MWCNSVSLGAKRRWRWKEHGPLLLLNLLWDESMMAVLVDKEEGELNPTMLKKRGLPFKKMLILVPYCLVKRRRETSSAR